MTYSEKLRDPRWQKKRLKILERDKWSCRFCQSTEKTLHVHHLKYVGDPWEAPDEMLITLCEDCHEFETDNRKVFEQDFISMLRESGCSCNDLVSLMNAVRLAVARETIFTTADLIELVFLDDALFAQVEGAFMQRLQDRVDRQNASGELSHDEELGF